MSIIVVNIRANPELLGSFYIGRPSVYGNPFRIGPDGTRKEVVDRYESEVIPTLDLEPLMGYAFFVCWCTPLLCHGDPLARAVEAVIRARGVTS